MSNVNKSIPNEVSIVLTELTKQFESILSINLEGVYLHGSVAMGCYKPDSSDIDVLVVVSEKISPDLRHKLGKVMLKISEEFGKNIEISVVIKQELLNFKYPTPFEFHYSDDHKEDFQRGGVDYQEERTDYDLAAHFVITRKFGISLVGIPAEKMFPKVPRFAYLDSITRDSEWSYDLLMKGGDEDCWVPKYAVLNFCRVLAFIHNNLITSKETGGKWGLEKLPPQFEPIITAALQEYQKERSAPFVNGKLLKEFAVYSFNKIKMSSIEVLQPESSDVGEIEALFRLVITDTFNKNGIKQLRPNEIEDEVSEKMGNLKNEFHLIAKLEGVIVGIIGVGRVNEEIIKNYSGDIPTSEVEVKDVYVLPTFQSRGVGNRLFTEIAKELEKRELKYFYLDSGFKLAQDYWRHKLGEPSVIKENYFGEGEHYMIWKCEVASLVFN